MKHGRVPVGGLTVTYFFSSGSTRPCGCSRSHGGWQGTRCRGGGRRRTRLGRHRGGFVGAGSRGAAAAGIGRRNLHPVGIRRFPLRPIGTNLRWCCKGWRRYRNVLWRCRCNALPTMSLRSTWCMGWRKQLRRLAQQHVTQTDSQTIINAIRT